MVPGSLVYRNKCSGVLCQAAEQGQSRETKMASGRWAGGGRGTEGSSPSRLFFVWMNAQMEKNKDFFIESDVNMRETIFIEDWD